VYEEAVEEGFISLDVFSGGSRVGVRRSLVMNIFLF